MNVDKIIKSIKSKFIIFGCLTIMLITATSNFNHMFTNILVHDLNRTVELVRDDRKDIAAYYEDLLELKKSDWFDKVTGYGETIELVSNKFDVHAEDIKVVMTDSEYSSIYKINMLKGNFLDSRTMDRGACHAVVSEKLARKLFKTLDIIGNEIDMLGEKYTITGVYKGKGLSVWDFLGDSFDRIYIPYNSVKNFEKKPVDVISVLIKPKLGMDATKRFLENELGTSMLSYTRIEYPVTGSVFHQYFDLIIFIIGVLAVIFTLIFMIKCFLNIRNSLVKKTNSQYLKDIVKTEWKSLMPFLITILVLCIVIIAIMKSIQFKFIIPDKYVPSDNIFDIQFYMNSFINDIRTSITNKSDVVSFLNYNYDHVYGANIACAFLAAILLTVAMTYYKLLLEFDINFYSIIRCLSLLMVTGGLLGIITSIFTGIGLAFPVKTWVILMVFYVMYGFNRRSSLSKSWLST